MWDERRRDTTTSNIPNPGSESPRAGIDSKTWEGVLVRDGDAGVGAFGSTRHGSLSNSNLHHPQMAIHAYSGQGLSLSQLVFALNEELKRIAYCSS